MRRLLINKIVVIVLGLMINSAVIAADGQTPVGSGRPYRGPYIDDAFPQLRSTLASSRFFKLPDSLSFESDTLNLAGWIARLEPEPKPEPARGFVQITDGSEKDFYIRIRHPDIKSTDHQFDGSSTVYHVRLNQLEWVSTWSGRDERLRHTQIDVSKWAVDYDDAGKRLEDRCYRYQDTETRWQLLVRTVYSYWPTTGKLLYRTSYEPGKNEPSHIERFDEEGRRIKNPEAPVPPKTTDTKPGV